tara:strand:+ start:3552 stop:3779 length:228 start_codon:yes stop_codon:yes gene_type:complete
MIKKKLEDCIKKIFPKKKIKSFDNLKFGSFKEWDSLAHLNLLLIIEGKFQIKFTMKQMYEIKKISDIEKIIKSKK